MDLAVMVGAGVTNTAGTAVADETLGVGTAAAVTLLRVIGPVRVELSLSESQSMGIVSGSLRDVVDDLISLSSSKSALTGLSCSRFLLCFDPSVLCTM